MTSVLCQETAPFFNRETSLCSRCALYVCAGNKRAKRRIGEMSKCNFLPVSLLWKQKTLKSGKRNRGEMSFFALNKMDTIVDFRQMIFKIIIQNLQTSNKSASQKNNQRQHQRTFRIFQRIKVRGGGEIFQNKNAWYWRHTESPFPTAPPPTSPQSQH